MKLAYLLGLLLLVPTVYAGTCLLSSNECITSTQSTASGPLPPNYYDGTQATCEDTSKFAGQYLGTSEIFNSYAQCTLGCCCGTQPQQSIGAACSAANYRTPVAGDDASCSLTCNTPAGQTACGEGPIANNACYCGSQNDLQGAFCCWNSKPAPTSNQCDPKQTAPACLVTDPTHNNPITQTCMCGANAINSGVCCYGQIQQTTQGSCQPAPPPAACGNGIKQGTEECDEPGTLTSAQCSASHQNTPGWTCTASCSCLSIRAQSGTYPDGVCDPNEDPVTNPQDCFNSNRCTTPLSGSLASPTITAADYDLSANTVTINWTNPTECDSSRISHQIRRSSVSSSSALNNPDFVSAPINKNAVVFVDSNLPVSTTVLYYELTTFYQMSTGSIQAFNVSIQVNKKSPDCPIANVQYCKDPHTRVVCVNYVNTAPAGANCAASICTMTGTVATCVAESPECYKCNGLFESFIDDNAKICKATPAPGQSCNLEYCNLVKTCYKDLKDTSVPLYQSCANVNSCTSYRTQAACENNDNTCKKPGPCQWLPLTSSAGGICKPQNSAYAKCSDCDSLGLASCTQQACNAISPTCIYNDPNDDWIKDNKICLDPKDMLCEYYGSQSTCEGSSVYDLDSTYDSNGIRDGITNHIDSRSGDAGQIGKCVWFSTNQCLKDADKDGIADRDQVDQTRQHQLLLDTSSPVTNILAIPNINYSSSINFATSKEPGSIAYGCLAMNNAGCYPLASLSNPYITTLSTSGNYELRFYSEDEARNLEEVKSFQFSVDATPPNYTMVLPINQTLIRQTSGALKSLTSLHFYTNETAQCTTRLLDRNTNNVAPSVLGFDPNNNPYTELNAFGKNFSVTYLLNKGMYYVNISCIDAVGNKNTLQPLFGVTVDTDFNITNLTPKMAPNAPITNPTVLITAQTISSATCRYGPIGQQYSAMSPLATTDGTNHSKTINTVSGITNYTVACDFSGRIEYEDTEQISIVIDRDGPTTIACDQNGKCGTLINTTMTDANFALSLSCKDNPVEFASRPCTTRWCLENSTGCTLVNYNGLPLTKNLLQIAAESDVRIRVRSIDALLNQETAWYVIVSTRDRTPPLAPTFSVEP